MKLIRLEKLVFALLLIILPWQLKDVLIPYERGGVFLEFRSISLLASDLLLLALILLFLWRRWLEAKPFQLSLSALGFLPALLSLMSLPFALDKLLALNFALHFLLAGFLFFYLLEEKPSLNELALPLVIGVVIQLIVGLGQFLTGRSLGLSFLDEAVLDAQAKNNIVVDFLGARRLRVYGLTANPNFLGVYGAVAAFLLSGARPLAAWPAVGLTLLTFSRGALLGLGPALLLWLGRLRRRAWPLFLTLLLGLTLLAPGWLSRFDARQPREVRSIEERISGTFEAWRIFQAKRLLGVGAGNYTVALEVNRLGQPLWNYLPVHNVFLLSLVELGGLALILWFALILSLARFASPIGILLSLVIFPSLLTEPSLWSLQEGRLLLLLVWALALRGKELFA